MGVMKRRRSTVHLLATLMPLRVDPRAACRCVVEARPYEVPTVAMLVSDPSRPTASTGFLVDASLLVYTRIVCSSRSACGLGARSGSNRTVAAVLPDPARPWASATTCRAIATPDALEGERSTGHAPGEGARTNGASRPCPVPGRRAASTIPRWSTGALFERAVTATGVAGALRTSAAVPWPAYGGPDPVHIPAGTPAWSSFGRLRARWLPSSRMQGRPLESMLAATLWRSRSARPWSS